MKDLKIRRKENETVFVVEKLGWKYHHLGIPVKTPIENERHIPHLKMHVSGFESSPFGIEWIRFEEDSPLPGIVKTLPHVAFEVDDLDKTLQKFDFNVIVSPNSPMEDTRVAMIEHNNAPVELIEFRKKDGAI